MNEVDHFLTSVTAALTTITKEIGPDAADAITFVYRLEALKAIGAGFLFVAATIFLIWVARSAWISMQESKEKFEAHKAVEKDAREDDHEQQRKKLHDNASIDLGVFACLGLSGVITAFCGLSILMSPYVWLAVLGTPGPMIAKRALEAAGML